MDLQVVTHPVPLLVLEHEAQVFQDPSTDWERQMVDVTDPTSGPEGSGFIVGELGRGLLPRPTLVRH